MVPLMVVQEVLEAEVLDNQVLLDQETLQTHPHLKGIMVVLEIVQIQLEAEEVEQEQLEELVNQV